MYVLRLHYVTVSMERDSINWAKGRGLSKKSYFTSTPLAVMLLGTKFELRNHEEVPQDHSRPFHN